MSLQVKFEADKKKATKESGLAKLPQDKMEVVIRNSFAAHSSIANPTNTELPTFQKIQPINIEEDYQCFGQTVNVDLDGKLVLISASV